MVASKRPVRRAQGENPLLAVRAQNIETAKKIISSRYGFVPPDQYVIDLIAFVNEMMQGTVIE